MELTNFSKPDGSVISFRLSYTAEEYRPYLMQCAAALEARRPITGFRAGKAPLEVAASVYGKALFEAAGQQAGSDMFRRAVEENQYPVVGKPLITTVANSPEGLVLDVIVPVYPEVTMGDYKGIAAERPDDSVTEKDVDAELARFCDQHRVVEPARRPAEDGDIVYFSYDGTCGGKPFVFSHSDRSQVRLGDADKEVFPGLPAALYGAVPGKTFDIELDMPENFGREDIAGKRISLHIEVQEVLERRVPELTDELIARYCAPLKTVDEYRENYREKLSAYRTQEADRVFSANIERALVDAVKAIVPKDMIQSQYEVNYRSFIDSLHASNISLDAFLENGGLTRDDMERITRQEAERQVRLSLALDKIAELEHIEVTPEELNARYDREVKRGAGEAYTYDDALQELRCEKAMSLVKTAANPITIPRKD